MPTASSLPPEETARLGKQIYERVVLPKMQPSDKGRVVAIDVKTEAWALDEGAIAAAQKLRAERPDAEVWLVRVGFDAYHRMGGHARRTSS